MASSFSVPALAPFLRRLAFTYIVFVALMLLMPFRLVRDPELIAANARAIASLHSAESVFSAQVIADVLQNLVLFLPFGLFCRAAGVGVRLVTLGGFLVSLGAEILQLFMPDRCASVGDLVTNTLGTFAGACAFRPCRRPLEWLLRGALKALPLRLAPLGAAVCFALVMAALFLQVVPARMLTTAQRTPVYLGGLPEGQFAWRGVIRRIALWHSEIDAPGDASSPPPAPLLDVDFRGGSRDRLCAALPPGAAWTDAGLQLGGGEPVALAAEHAEAVAAALGSGGPFSICVWSSPERLDFRQRGSLLGAGRDTWHADCWIGQWGPDASFFNRTTISGPDWDRPVLVVPDGVRACAEQEWLFTFDGASVRARINGTWRSEVLSLRWWATPAGLLLASPAVVEPLTLYAAMFLVYAGMLAAGTVRGRRGTAIALAAGVAAPALGVIALSWACGLPVQPLALAAVPLGAALGTMLGRAWACAARAG